MNELLKDASTYAKWLEILNKKSSDKRMRDEELILRFFAFYIHGVASYRTPQKHWLNDAARDGMKYNQDRINELQEVWETAIDVSLVWFEPAECFRRHGSRAVNRALFDLVATSAATAGRRVAPNLRADFRARYDVLLADPEFQDLISRAVDHTRRTRRRFEMWNQAFDGLL